MLPFVPPFNQVQQHGASGASQQGLPPNAHLMGPCNSGSNLTPQPCQLRSNGCQVPIAAQFPFDNRNSNWNNVGSFPHRPPSVPAACFPNAIPNNHLFMQINQHGMNQFGYFPHGHPGNVMQNLNQFMAANASMQPNGQFLLQSALGNMGQVIPVQCSPVPMVPLNLAPLPNHHNVQAQGAQNYETVHGNLDSGMLHNGTNQIFNQRSTDVHPPNMTAKLELHSTDQQQQASLFSSKSQMNQGNNGGYNNSNFKQRLANKNFQRNDFGTSKVMSQHSGSRKPHFNQNGKGSFQSWNGRKGHQNKGKSNSYKFDRMPMSEPKRTIVPLNYPEEEIQKWREERKKNFPTKSLIEKKLSDKQSNKDVFERDAKIRRQQLKEILNKQAELGVEVAELPPNYLSESENQVSEIRGERGWQHKRGKFGNKFDKRSRSGFKDNWQNKKHKFGPKSTQDTVPSRKPTLLEKLLITDIKRDKSHLLQVFRFMVLNSFFKDWPEQSLEFPLVGVKDEIRESGKIEEEPSSRNGGLLDSRVKDNGQENHDHCVIDEGDDDDEDLNVGEGMQPAYIRGRIAHSESEEGEIFD